MKKKLFTLLMEFKKTREFVTREREKKIKKIMYCIDCNLIELIVFILYNCFILNIIVVLHHYNLFQLHECE